MIEFRYQTFENKRTIKFEVSPENFYDPIEFDESYENEGVEIYIDLRDYVNEKRSSIHQLEVKTLSYKVKIEYGIQGSITQHTTYLDNSEMIVVQNQISDGLINSVTLKKSADSKWVSSISLIDDERGLVSNLK
jgi:hypothetical protein